MTPTPRQAQIERVERELAQESAFRVGVDLGVEDGYVVDQGGGEVVTYQSSGDLGDYYDRLKALGAQSAPAPVTAPAGRVPFGAGMTAPPPNPHRLTAQQRVIADQAIARFIARVETMARGRLDLMPDEDIAKARDLALADLDQDLP